MVYETIVFAYTCQYSDDIGDTLQRMADKAMQYVKGNLVNVNHCITRDDNGDYLITLTVAYENEY